MSRKTCLLTGHTRGFGFALSEKLARENWRVCGASRATDHDIQTESGRGRVVRLSLEVRVFINNAHSGFGQVQLLSEVFQAWRAQGKSGTILNIGSKAGSEFPRPGTLVSYDYEKLALHQLSKSLWKIEPSIRVMCINFGYISTEGILARAELNSVPKLPLQQAVDTAFWLLNLPDECVAPEISLFPVG